MSKFVLTNVRLFSGGCDLTAQSNKLELSSEAEDKDVTNFGSGGWKEVKGGLFSTEISGAGQWEAADASKVDDNRWSSLGGLGPFSAGPDDAAVGNLSYFTNALSGKYQLGGQVGDVAPWDGEWKGSWPLVRGLFAHSPGTPRTADGTGTGQQLGAVASGKYLYANLHVLSVAGTSTPTITARIESDADNTFASPTTVLTFTAATAVSGEVKRVAGAITDTWFRPAWTITGSSPSFLFVVTYGIA
ncbi:MAG TPA: hypothetical protein VGX25_04755 [Actinophytocola sp.]|uniref:hypothetical protein n=1 Tax=Actinophytocola sp. TaxID=1872138 RepID=UPI002DDD1372|nr:hypothetical protein [Actinophytocola sp.]HEV2778692.1 hypothetical protein [Actinophytocola sp.]